MTDPQPNLAQKIAKLARIRLSADQLEATEAQFASIVAYIHQLDEVVIADDIEPFFGATESVNATRPDQVVDSYAREKIIANAPQTDGEFYKVPSVFEK
jgi:aspartyl-tRNA(Asn)/glutamyl-tRNA(Gln) amidotransferase subunit C